MIDCRIERFQSELIEKQVREIQNMYRQVRGWRHDFCPCSHTCCYGLCTLSVGVYRNFSRNSRAADCFQEREKAL